MESNPRIVRNWIAAEFVKCTGIRVIYINQHFHNRPNIQKEL